jgi:hypothetical protein
MQKELQRQFRIENYKTDDWLTPIPEKEIFFIPTQIDMIDIIIL